MPCHNPFGRRWLFIMAVLITFVLFLLLKWFEGFPYYNNLLAHQQLNKTESNKLRIGTSETEKDSGPMEEGQNQNNEQVGEEEVSEAQAKEKEVGNKELENLKYEAETNKTDERQQVCWSYF